MKQINGIIILVVAIVVINVIPEVSSKPMSYPSVGKQWKFEDCLSKCDEDLEVCQHHPSHTIESFGLCALANEQCYKKCRRTKTRRQKRARNALSILKLKMRSIWKS